VAESWQIDPAVLVTDLDDELVLLVPTTRAMFTLNETGRLIWELLVDGTDVDSAVDVVSPTYEVVRDSAARDVAALVATMVDAGLLVRR